MIKSKIKTRSNFNGQDGKDFIVESGRSIFLTNYQIRKIGGVEKVKEVIEDLIMCFGSYSASSVISHSNHI